jgi:hypothetical protein
MRMRLVDVPRLALLGGISLMSCVGLPPPPPDDDVAEDTASSDSAPACEPLDEPAYAECEQGACSAAELCAVDANPPAFTVCARTGCQDDCDCPAPISGTALPICSSFADHALPSACYLACDSDAECPLGMLCVQGQLCMFPI